MPPSPTQLLPLSLCIADPALHAAVLEQLIVAAIPANAVARFSDLPVAPDAVWLLDAADVEPAALPVASGGPTILGLGDLDHPAIVETFPKPLRLGHFIAHLRRHLDPVAHSKRTLDLPVTFGPLRLEPRDRLLRAGDIIIRLTEKEAALLAFLARQADPVSRRDLLAEVWGYDERIDTHTLETHVYQLRRKLEPVAPDWLIFADGGYRLAPLGTDA